MQTSSLTGAVGGRALARLARDQGLISDETLTAVDGLSVLRNLAAHSSTDEIGAERAHDYLALADAVLFALKAKPGSRVATARPESRNAQVGAPSG